MKDEDKAEVRRGGGILYFPTVAAPITVSYNLRGVDELNLDAEHPRRIFQGEDHDVERPGDRGRQPRRRPADTAIMSRTAPTASGTTSNFTKYLAAAAPDTWTLGTGDTVNWPPTPRPATATRASPRSSSDTDGAIGYVDFADADGREPSSRSIKNEDGKFVAPTLEAPRRRSQSARSSPTSRTTRSTPSGADAYPITVADLHHRVHEPDRPDDGRDAEGLDQLRPDRRPGTRRRRRTTRRCRDAWQEKALAQLDQITVG